MGSFEIIEVAIIEFTYFFVSSERLCKTVRITQIALIRILDGSEYFHVEI
jgi:hypothetical protein